MELNIFQGLVYTIPDSFLAVVKTIADRPSVYTIPDSFLAVVKTIADRPSVYTIPDSFRAVVKTIADRPSAYTTPDSFLAVVKTVADRPSVYTIPDSFLAVGKTTPDRSVYVWKDFRHTVCAFPKVKRSAFATDMSPIGQVFELLSYPVWCKRDLKLSSSFHSPCC